MDHLPELAAPGARPAMLHFVWLGPRPLWVRLALRRWLERTELDGWAMRVWGENDAPWLPFIRSQAPHLSLRAQADFVRLAAVHQYGGVYLDVDTVPLRPLDLDRQDDWIGSKPVPEGRHTLINAHFGMASGTRFLADVWDLGWQNVAAGRTNDHWIAGPRTWRKVYDATPGSLRPTLVPRFPTITSGPLTRALPRGHDIDTQELAQQYPEATLLHVVYDRGAVA